jgi:putative membrane protein
MLLLLARSVVGGTLMGLANLVPGISGGTMLLAAGVYPRFITAIGEVTTLKFRRASMVALSAIVVAAVLAILLLAGPVKDLVVSQRWVMYSLFIGLTLGGVPVILRMIGRMSTGVYLASLVGFGAMAALALFQAVGAGAQSDGTEQANFLLMFVAGVAGASAMILPGVSGGYLLLVLGVYVPILGGIDAFKDALQGRDFTTMTSVGLAIVLPVGMGVLLGVAVVSNILRWLLAEFERPTLGVLLGLLVGAVVGLWPFQRGVAPEVGETFRGRTVTAESLRMIKPENFPTEFFTPSITQVVLALLLVASGFIITAAVARLGREKKPAP